MSAAKLRDYGAFVTLFVMVGAPVAVRVNV
jgi:hypothetical protein